MKLEIRRVSSKCAQCFQLHFQIRCQKVRSLQKIRCVKRSDMCVKRSDTSKDPIASKDPIRQKIRCVKRSDASKGPIAKTLPRGRRSVHGRRSPISTDDPTTTDDNRDKSDPIRGALPRQDIKDTRAPRSSAPLIQTQRCRLSSTKKSKNNASAHFEATVSKVLLARYIF